MTTLIEFPSKKIKQAPRNCAEFFFQHFFSAPRLIKSISEVIPCKDRDKMNVEAEVLKIHKKLTKMTSSGTVRGGKSEKRYLAASGSIFLTEVCCFLFRMLKRSTS